MSGFGIDWHFVAVLLLCAAFRVNLKHTELSLPSSGDVDDWDRLEVRPGHAGVQNVLYLNDEEEEEEEDGEEAEQGQDVRKVTVRNDHDVTQLC